MSSTQICSRTIITQFEKTATSFPSEVVTRTMWMESCTAGHPVEPPYLLSLNLSSRPIIDRLRASEGRSEVKRYSRSYLQVGQAAQELEGALQKLCELDFAWSCGELSARMAAHCPGITYDGELRLDQARHPLLLLSEETTVIPNDIALSPQRPVLVLTGPNTGGKPSR